MTGRNAEAWIVDMEAYFQKFCEEYSVDSNMYNFSIVKNRNGMLVSNDIRSLVLKGHSRAGNKQQIDVELYRGDCYLPEVSIPCVNQDKKKYKDNADVLLAFEQRTSKIIACHILLSTGIEHKPGKFPFASAGIWFRQSVSDMRKPEPDYGFLSELDLNVEEDCLTGLLYLSNIACQFNQKTLYKEFSQKELLNRTRLVAKAIKAYQNATSDTSDVMLENYTDCIFWGRTPDRYFLSSKPFSPKELKETEKLVHFLIQEDDTVKYEDYRTPPFALFSIDKAQRKILRKTNLKKMASPKIVSQVLNGMCKSEILDIVVPVMTAMPLSISVESALMAIEDKKKELKEPLHRENDDSIHLIALTCAMDGISQCLTLIEKEVNKDNELEFWTFKKNAKTLLGYVTDSVTIPLESPFVTIMKMMPGYMRNHPTDIDTLIRCVDMSKGFSHSTIFNSSPFERWQFLEDLRRYRSDEEAIILISNAIVYHKRNKDKKYLGKSEWRDIARSPEKYEGMPFEWIHGLLEKP